MTDDLDLVLRQEIYCAFEHDIVDDVNSILALTIHYHDVDTYANCCDDCFIVSNGDTGANHSVDCDIVSNSDNVANLLCCICNINDDSIGDETSDDVKPIDDNTIDYDDFLPLFSDDDIYDNDITIAN